MNGWTDGRTDGRTDGWMDSWAGGGWMQLNVPLMCYFKQTMFCEATLKRNANICLVDADRLHVLVFIRISLHFLINY